MSGTTGDVLTQARTPTDAEELAGWLEPSGATTAGDVLELAAPRILALAYREAARHFRGFIIRSGDTFDAAEVVKQLEALATALEEGTPT